MQLRSAAVLPAPKSFTIMSMACCCANIAGPSSCRVLECRLLFCCGLFTAIILIYFSLCFPSRFESRFLVLWGSLSNADSYIVMVLLLSRRKVLLGELFFIALLSFCRDSGAGASTTAAFLFAANIPGGEIGAG